MNRKATITIHGHQYYEDSEENNEINFITDGEFDAQDGAYSIQYKESEMTGLAGVSTTISVKDGKVVLERHGDVNSQMVFQNGERHHTIYDMGEGTMTMCVGTKLIRNRLNPNGGSLAMNYTLEVNHALMSKNRISIKVDLE